MATGSGVGQPAERGKPGHKSPGALAATVRPPGGTVDVMSARPVTDPDPDDPVEILRVLPEQFHEQFLAEYAEAADAARQVQGFRALHDLLRLWRLTAIACTAPGYYDRLASVRESVSTGSLEGSVPIEDAVPDWHERLRRQ